VAAIKTEAFVIPEELQAPHKDTLKKLNEKTYLEDFGQETPELEHFVEEAKKSRQPSTSDKEYMKQRKKLGEVLKIEAKCAEVGALDVKTGKVDVDKAIAANVDKMQLKKLELKAELEKQVSELEKEVNGVLEDEAKKLKKKWIKDEDWRAWEAYEKEVQKRKDDEKARKKAITAAEKKFEAEKEKRIALERTRHEREREEREKHAEQAREEMLAKEQRRRERLEKEAGIKR